MTRATTSSAELGSRLAGSGSQNEMCDERDDPDKESHCASGQCQKHKPAENKHREQCFPAIDATDDTRVYAAFVQDASVCLRDRACDENR